MAEPRHFSRLGPAIIAVAVALVCVGSLVLLVRDRWNRPEVKPPEVARSVDSAGAKVLPTEPKLAVEPKPAAPPPVQPANPN